MLISFDENHLLSIQNPSLAQLKPYHYTLSGWSFSSFDKEIFVYYKRSRKLINFKNLGDGMQVAYLKSDFLPLLSFDKVVLERTLAMFHAFDEESGQKYAFLPSFSKNIDSFQSKLKQSFGIDCLIEKKQWWTFVYGLTKEFAVPDGLAEFLSFVFSLILLYGKFDEKDGEVLGAKAHIPLFWVRNSLEQELIRSFERLAEQGIFISQNLLRNQDKTTLQFSTNDPELLRLFSRWWNESKLIWEQELVTLKFDQKQAEIRLQLLDFLDSLDSTQYNNINEIKTQIQSGLLKFLK